MGAGKGKRMAIKIQKSKSNHNECNACGNTNSDATIFDIYIGKENQGTIHRLCDACMHELLQKMIIIGSKYNELH